MNTRALLGAIFAAALAVRNAAATPCASCPNASFGPRPDQFPASPLTGAGSLAVGDFDGDGIPDLVASYYIDGTAWFRGLPGGRLSAGTLIDSSFGSVLAYDLDGDGRLDILSWTGSLNVRWGNGDGTFSPPQIIFNTGSIGGVAVSDMNADGKLDVVVSDVGFWVLTNTGARTFAPVHYGNSILTSLLVLGDFNGDGHPDVVIEDIVIGAPAQVYLNAGDGTFPGPPIVDGSSGYSQIRGAADFDRDGKLDLVVVGTDISILYGNGDGTFGAPVPVEAAPSQGLIAIVIDDRNRDGRTDLVIAGYPSTLDIRIALPGRSFSPPLAYRTQVSAVAVADVDQDGIPDLLTANGFGILTLFRGTSSGALSAPLPLGPPDARAHVQGFFDAGPTPDIATLTGTGLQVWLGDGAGGFSAGTSSAVADQSYLAAADFNHDGRMDFVTVERTGFFPTAGKIHVFLGAANGSLTALTPMDLPFVPNAVWAGNLDGDSNPDILITSIASGSPGWGVRVLTGNGDGTFSFGPTAAQDLTLGNMVVRDIDGDGKLDIVASRYADGHVSVLRGHGDATFGAPDDYFLGGFDLAVEDFDGDGKLDILTSSKLTFLRGRGDGTFEPGLFFPSSPTGDSITTLDFDGDGVLDVALGSGAELILMRGNGDGTFTRSLSLPGAVFGARALVADWNSDGRTDLAVVSAAGETVLLNTRCLARRIEVVSQPGACQVADVPFGAQVELFDDGGNAVTCPNGAVSADIAPGTGAPGATLAGTLSQLAPGGFATFSDLSIDLPHSPYRLEFHHPTARPIRSSSFSVRASGFEPVFAPSVACASSPGNVASVGDRGAGTTYAWTVGNGTITGGQGTPAITFTAGASGSVSIDVVVTEPNACAASGSRSVPVAATCGLGFFSVPPCRVADTRSAEGPAITAGSLRSFAVGGRCGVPAGAASVALNVAVTGSSAGGNLTLYPSGGAVPSTSTINYGAGRTRSNNAVLPLGAAGQIGVQCNQPSGSVHLILDVTGYFQ